MQSRLPGLRRRRSDRLRTGHYRGIPHPGEEAVSTCQDRRAVQPALHRLPAGALPASTRVVVLLVSSDSFECGRGLILTYLYQACLRCPRLVEAHRVYSDGSNVAPHELPPVFGLRSLLTENPKGGGVTKS